MYIMVNFTWNVITFINSIKITLSPLELKALIKFFLLYLFFETKSAFTSSCISRNKIQTAISQLRKTSFKDFFIEIEETSGNS